MRTSPPAVRRLLAWPHVVALAAVAAGLIIVVLAADAGAVTNPDSEQKSAALVNHERDRRGLPPLRVCADLREVARRWSDHMAGQGRLTHNPGLTSQVNGWRQLHENVGWDTTVGGVHLRLMGSSAHRANVLTTTATEIGVGVEHSGGRVWVTQVYRQPSGTNGCVRLDDRILHACPTVAPMTQFADVYGNVHRHAIDCIARYRLSNGTTHSRYAPARTVTRGQLASFLVRLLERSGAALPPASSVYSDIAGNAHAGAVNKLRAAGLVEGTSETTFEPDSPVTRGQTAAMLVAAYERAAGEGVTASRDWFTDDGGSRHQDAINEAAQAGFVTGLSASRYAPDRGIRRDQVASSLARAFDRLMVRGHATPP